ncbi:MAG: GtrA family protein [Bacteroidia bacterium]
MQQHLSKLNKKEGKRFLRYAMVGGVATGVDIGVYTLLREVWGVKHWVALFLSFSSGILTNFVISRSFVFEAQAWYWGGQLRRFIISSVLVFVFSGVLMQLMYRILDLWPFLHSSWDSFVVRGVVSGITLFLSYGLHRVYSFRRH